MKRAIPGKGQPTWLWLALIAVVLLGILFYNFAQGLGLLLLILVLNAFASYLKRFTAAVPIDIEFLAVGAAFLGGYFGFGYALLLAVIGPPVSEYIQGGIGEFVWVKMICVALTAVAAALFGHSQWGLFAAVVVGLIVQYICMLAITGEAALNAVRRITNAVFSAYIIFFIVPLLH
jgi:hypothetical protein